MGSQGEWGRGAGKGAVGLPGTMLGWQHVSKARLASPEQPCLLAWSPNTLYGLQREMDSSQPG